MIKGSFSSESAQSVLAYMQEGKPVDENLRKEIEERRTFITDGIEYIDQGSPEFEVKRFNAKPLLSGTRHDRKDMYAMRETVCQASNRCGTSDPDYSNNKRKAYSTEAFWKLNPDSNEYESTVAIQDEKYRLYFLKPDNTGQKIDNKLEGRVYTMRKSDTPDQELRVMSVSKEPKQIKWYDGMSDSDSDRDTAVLAFYGEAYREKPDRPKEIVVIKDGKAIQEKCKFYAKPIQKTPQVKKVRHRSPKDVMRAAAEHQKIKDAAGEREEARLSKFSYLVNLSVETGAPKPIGKDPTDNSPDQAQKIIYEASIVDFKLNKVVADKTKYFTLRHHEEASKYVSPFFALPKNCAIKGNLGQEIFELPDFILDDGNKVPVVCICLSVSGKEDPIEGTTITRGTLLHFIEKNQKRLRKR